MSKQTLFRMNMVNTYENGRLTTNSRLGRGGSQKPPFAPNNEPHANECGCLKCRVITMTDEAIERELGELAADRDALAPTPGVLGNSRSKRSVSGPLLLPRGVLAGGEA